MLLLFATWTTSNPQHSAGIEEGDDCPYLSMATGEGEPLATSATSWHVHLARAKSPLSRVWRTMTRCTLIGHDGKQSDCQCCWWWEGQSSTACMAREGGETNALWVIQQHAFLSFNFLLLPILGIHKLLTYSKIEVVCNITDPRLVINSRRSLI